MGSEYGKVGHEMSCPTGIRNGLRNDKKEAGEARGYRSRAMRVMIAMALTLNRTCKTGVCDTRIWAPILGCGIR